MFLAGKLENGELYPPTPWGLSQGSTPGRGWGVSSWLPSWEGLGVG